MDPGMKILQLVFRFCFTMANIPVILLFLLSGYSDRVSPDTSVFFSYLGLIFPLLLLLNIGFLLVAIFLMRWRLVVAGVISLLLCWEPTHRYFPFHGYQDISEGNVLKVLTYNVMGFAYLSHTEKSPNPILAYIDWLDADIVCLQEYAESTRSSHLTRKKIQKALKRYPYHQVTIKKRIGIWNYGTAVFSKYPILNSKQIAYKSKYNISTIHEIDLDGKKLTLINNHLESFKLTSKDRSLYSSFITHLGADEFGELRDNVQEKLGDAFKIRAKQAEAVAAAIQQVKDGYLMVCGDFNDTPISYAHRTIQGPLRDAFADSGMGMGITYNQNYFWFRIDHILHSPNMKSMNCTVDKEEYSDHYPLWSYLQLSD